MTLYQGRKKRYCGYCRMTLDYTMEDYMAHLDYCEMALSSKASEDRHKKKKGENGIQPQAT